MNVNSSCSQYLMQLTSDWEADEDFARSQIRSVIQSATEDLIGELIAHPEQVENYHEIQERLRKLDIEFFRQIHPSISSIQRIARILRENNADKLDHFTRYLDTSQAQTFHATTIEYFHNLYLPRDIEIILSIKHPDVRIRVLATLINRDHIPIRDLHLSKEDIMDIGPHLTTLDWQALMQTFGRDFPNIDHPDTLSLAVAHNLPHVVHALAQLGTNPNQLNAHGRFPLLQASSLGHLETVQALIDAGANVNQANDAEMTPLRIAIRSNNPHMVKTLIAADANISLQTSTGMTPLLFAIFCNNHEIVQVLIDAGANVNQSNHEGLTPLFCAVFQENLKIVQVLVTTPGIVVNHECPGRGTPLDLALSDFPDIAPPLIEAGADYICAENAIEAKFLSHVWGLAGESQVRGMDNKTHRVSLEGFRPRFAIRCMMQYAKDFFVWLNDHEETPCKKKDIESTANYILEALSRAYPNESLMQLHTAWDSGIPCLIYLKISDHTPHAIKRPHAIVAVIKGNRLSISNRGEGRREDATEVFELPNLDTLKARVLIDKLSDVYESPEALYQMLDSWGPIKIGGYDHKNQKGDYCTVASLKAALYVLFVDCLGEEEGKKMYKNFTSFLRRKTLENDIQKNGLDSPLVQLTTKKTAKKKQEEIDLIP